MKDVYTKEMVRRAYHREGKSRRQIARELGIHRETVKKLLEMGAGEIPEYKRKKGKERPVLGRYTPIIDQWLKEDETAPRKQRHTKKRIYERLKAEHGFPGGYSTVKDYIAQTRPMRQEVFVPLAFSPGEMGQVDWGEVEAVIDGVPKTLQIFGLVLNYSNTHYVEAFEQAGQESFFQGHQNAFGFFGGIPRTLTYDNLASAVTKILKGKERKENERFVAFRSACLFESRFCNPARGNEKGRIENVVKYAKNNYLTPVPEFTSLAELNAYLKEQCLAHREKHQTGHTQTMGERLQAEREHLLPLPQHPPECCRIVPVKANSASLVQFESNRYSVPMEYAYKTLWLKAFVDRVEIADEEKVIAVHSRLAGKYRESILFEHYRKVLERKPGALKHFRGTHPALPLSLVSGNEGCPAVHVQEPDIAKYALLHKRSAS